MNAMIAQHLDSLTFDPQLVDATRITIVDDVVTKGRMLAAVALLLDRHLPLSSLCGFALIRTMGLQSDVARIVDPTVGWIRIHGQDANRVDEDQAPPARLF